MSAERTLDFWTLYGCLVSTGNGITFTLILNRPLLVFANSKKSFLKLKLKCTAIKCCNVREKKVKLLFSYTLMCYFWKQNREF